MVSCATQYEIICADLRFGVSVGSVLQLHDWCRESSKNCKENALLLNNLRLYFCKPLCPSLNYIRHHMGIDGRTPSEKAGIKIEGLNKWITIIQNAQVSTFDGRKSSAKASLT